MGSGVSSTSLPSVIDIETARSFAGPKFSDELFTRYADEHGFISREMFLKLAAESPKTTNTVNCMSETTVNNDDDADDQSDPLDKHPRNLIVSATLSSESSLDSSPQHLPPLSTSLDVDLYSRMSRSNDLETLLDNINEESTPKKTKTKPSQRIEKISSAGSYDHHRNGKQPRRRTGSEKKKSNEETVQTNQRKSAPASLSSSLSSSLRPRTPSSLFAPTASSQIRQKLIDEEFIHVTSNVFNNRKNPTKQMTSSSSSSSLSSSKTKSKKKEVSGYQALQQMKKDDNSTTRTSKNTTTHRKTNDSSSLNGNNNNKQQERNKRNSSKRQTTSTQQRQHEKQTEQKERKDKENDEEALRKLKLKQTSESVIESLRNEPLPDLTFGVEYEVGLPIGLGKGKAIATKLNELTDIPIYYFGLTHKTTKAWKIVRDASVNVDKGYLPFEIVSPILTGLDGLLQVGKILETLEQLGAIVNQSTGHHVHVGASEMSLAQLKSIAAQYIKYEKAFDLMMPRSRQLDMNEYLQSNLQSVLKEQGGGTFHAILAIDHTENVQQLVDSINPSMFSHTNINRFGPGTSQYEATLTKQRYYKLNFTNLLVCRPGNKDPLGTLEFRHHSGTVTAIKSIFWIELILRFVDFCMKTLKLPKPLHSDRTPAETLLILFREAIHSDRLLHFWWGRVEELDEMGKKRLVRAQTAERVLGYAKLAQRIKLEDKYKHDGSDSEDEYHGMQIQPLNMDDSLSVSPITNSMIYNEAPNNVLDEWRLDQPNLMSSSNDNHDMCQQQLIDYESSSQEAEEEGRIYRHRLSEGNHNNDSSSSNDSDLETIEDDEDEDGNHIVRRRHILRSPSFMREKAEQFLPHWRRPRKPRVHVAFDPGIRSLMEENERLLKVSDELHRKQDHRLSSSSNAISIDMVQDTPSSTMDTTTPSAYGIVSPSGGDLGRALYAERVRQLTESN